MNEEDQRTLCQICNLRFEHLGSHVAKKHKLTAREYKEHFELDYKFSLISSTVRHKKQLAFEDDREKYLANFAKGVNYRFKKGESSRTRFSLQSVYRADETIKQYNQDRKTAQCPVCKARFEHMESHLYNKHNLKIAEK